MSVKEVFSGTNGTLSSKRITGTAVCVIGVLVPVVAMFLKPVGVIDMTVLMYSGELLTVGGALLGLGIAEKQSIPTIPKNNTDE